MVETILWRTCIAFQLLLIVAGHEMFNPIIDICCEGKLHPSKNSDGLYQQCCGDNAIPYINYNYQQSNTSNRSVCCDGVIYHSQIDYEDCCGKELIDTQKFACYNESEKVAIPESNKLNDEINICGRSSEFQFFNSARNVCCDGTLHPISDSQACCGDDYIDQMSHKMCYTLNEINWKMECKAIPLEGRSRFNTQCCNNDLYDFRDQICMNKKIFYKNATTTSKCCGYTYSYNSTINMWTSKKNENELDDENCDQLNFHTEEGICFGNKIIRVNQNESYQYCLWDSSTYIRNSQACCTGGVQNLTEDEISNSKSECCEVIEQSTLYQKMTESKFLNYMY